MNKTYHFHEVSIKSLYLHTLPKVAISQNSQCHMLFFTSILDILTICAY